MSGAHRISAGAVALGDRAVLLAISEVMDLDANAAARRIAAEVRARAFDWVTDVVPGLVTVTVHFDATTAREAAERRAALGKVLHDAAARKPDPAAERAARTVEIPVCYEPPFAPDVEEVAKRTGVPASEVAALHAATTHRVLMIGFAPGHPYLGGLDERLAVPRRASPRARVASGSVAIANGQTSIYPFATPGGWNVIGRTPLALFDPGRSPASLLEPGDAVRFAPISRAEFERLAEGRATG